MPSKNKKQTKPEGVTSKRIADYVFAFLAIILILSMIFSAFVTY